MLDSEIRAHIVNPQLLPQRLPTKSIFSRSSIDTVTIWNYKNDLNIMDTPLPTQTPPLWAHPWLPHNNGTFVSEMFFESNLIVCKSTIKKIKLEKNAYYTTIS